MHQLDSIPWEHDIAAALERAATEQKLVLLDIFNPG